MFLETAHNNFKQVSFGVAFPFFQKMHPLMQAGRVDLYRKFDSVVSPRDMVLPGSIRPRLDLEKFLANG
jgi:hypothetical protein